MILLLHQSSIRHLFTSFLCNLKSFLLLFCTCAELIYATEQGCDKHTVHQQLSKHETVKVFSLKLSTSCFFLFKFFRIAACLKLSPNLHHSAAFNHVEERCHYKKHLYQSNVFRIFLRKKTVPVKYNVSQARLWTHGCYL